MKDVNDKKKVYYQEEEIPLFLTVEDVANVLKISKPFAYNLFCENDFPAIKIGTRRLVRREKLLKWLEKHETASLN